MNKGITISVHVEGLKEVKDLVTQFKELRDTLNETKSKQEDKTLERIIQYIENNKDVEVWVASKDKEIAKEYWKGISKRVSHRSNTVRILNGRRNDEGLRAENAFIILCGKWYESSTQQVELIRYYLKDAKKIINLWVMPPY